MTDPAMDNEDSQAVEDEDQSQSDSAMLSEMDGLTDITAKDENPFVIPKDKDIFMIRIKQKEAKQRWRDEQSKLKVWEKTSSSVRISSGKAQALRRMAQMNRKGGIRGLGLTDTGSSNTHSGSTLSQAVLNERASSKENMAEFIAKKREMFLVQMSLDTKKDEIRKLEEKAHMKKQALEKAQQMLDEDEMRFESFIKENDAKSHEAMERYKREHKLKQDKENELKKLGHEIDKIESEIRKYEDSLQYCRKYKEFLDDLTPVEWLNDPARKPGDMYFQEPQQLLDIFSALEERNLFLIQNAQETEEAVDDLKMKLEMTKTQMSQRNQELEESIQELEDKLQTQTNKSEELKKKLTLLGMSGDNVQQSLLKTLSDKVSQVFQQCGFDPDQTPDTLGKLAKIEELLEQLIFELNEIPEALRRKLERDKETERRNRLRQEKMEKLEQEYEVRLKRSLERAARVEERVKLRKKTKPKMERSAPPKKKKKKQTELEKKKLEEERIQKLYFT